MNSHSPLINVAKKQSVEAYLNQLRTAPTDPIQERLTRTHIIPHLESMLVDFERLREAIDMAVNRLSVIHYGYPLKNLHIPSIDVPHIFYCPMLQSMVNHQFDKTSQEILANYPIGQCTKITWLAWHILVKETFLPRTEGFSCLQAFVSAGGNFQVIWGGIRHAEFQTAFQAGDYYFDISNDTSHIYKPKIAHSLLKESDFNDISSYREYVGIKSDYHQAEMFINNCFPRLFPYFPFFVHYRDKQQFVIDANMHMGRLNISTQFGTILDAMDDGCFENHLYCSSLEQINTSVKKIKGNKRSRDVLEFRIMDRDEMTLLLRSCAALDPAEHIEQLNAAEKICGFLNHVWAKESMGEQIMDKWDGSILGVSKPDALSAIYPLHGRPLQ